MTLLADPVITVRQRVSIPDCDYSEEKMEIEIGVDLLDGTVVCMDRVSDESELRVVSVTVVDGITVCEDQVPFGEEVDEFVVDKENCDKRGEILEEKALVCADQAVSDKELGDSIDVIGGISAERVGQIQLGMVDKEVFKDELSRNEICVYLPEEKLTYPVCQDIFGFELVD
ncbi:UNVERIFIED_CONTAM: hypothetical protein K2H54_053626 [Gekko kuhli]